jgi:hypothetical protein
MDKELENLLDNYERSIYGKEVPKMPTIHQIHLLLDYIANLEQQCKKQKEVIDELNDLLSDEFLEVIDRDTLLDILKEVSE